MMGCGLLRNFCLNKIGRTLNFPVYYDKRDGKIYYLIDEDVYSKSFISVSRNLYIKIIKGGKADRECFKRVVNY